jgi:hypothetical protein
METLYTVKINSKEFPTLDECTKETEVQLISIENGWNMVELIIESNEPDNVVEPEYQEPTYIVYITVDGDTVDRLVHPYAFEDMDTREMINVLVDMFMEHCN